MNYSDNFNLRLGTQFIERWRVFTIYSLHFLNCTSNNLHFVYRSILWSRYDLFDMLTFNNCNILGSVGCVLVLGCSNAGPCRG